MNESNKVLNSRVLNEWAKLLTSKILWLFLGVMALFLGDQVLSLMATAWGRRDWGHWCRKTELGLELSSYSVPFSSVAQLCPTLCLLLVVWYRKCFLTVFSFHFLICKVGIRHPYLKGCYVCESPGMELTWDQHSTSGHSLLSFYNNTGAAGIRDLIRKVILENRELPGASSLPHLPPGNITSGISDQPLQEAHSSSGSYQSLWGIQVKSLPLLVLPWVWRLWIEDSQILLFRIWAYFGVKSSVIFFF